jgi:hypothetical protein
MDDLDFHPKWVMPFYMDFGGIVLDKSEEEQIQLVQKAKVALQEISDETFLKMLKHGNWRPRQAAGWLIAVGKKSQFIPQINENLLKYPHYVQMYCMALVRIGEYEAIQGLDAYLNEYLKPIYAENSDAERLSVVMALAALDKLDINKNYFGSHYPERFNEFTKAHQAKYSWVSDEILSGIWNLERTKSFVAAWGAFVDKYFP